MNNMHFRNFDTSKKAERDIIIDMYTNNPNKYIIWDKEDSEYIEDSGYDYYGIFYGENLIALTSIETVTDTLCTMWSTIVKEGYRGQGIGKRLNDHLEKHLSKNGFKKISSHIYVENLANIILKLKRGYIIEGTLMNHDCPGQHEYILGIEL